MRTESRTSAGRNRGGGADRRVRPAVWAVVSTVCLIGTGVLLICQWQRPKPNSSPETRAAAQPVPVEAAESSKPAAELSLANGPPAPEMRELLNRLVKLEPAAAGLTPEQTAEWKRTWQRLIEQGPDAVPAIREYLARNVDLEFGERDRRALGYDSVRKALLEGLVHIRGPEGIQALRGVLQVTAAPREISFLARALEQLEPGVHGPEVLGAARETLALAAAGKLAGWDVAPLFEVFESCGETSLVAELERSGNSWDYYGAIALARLPDGAGVPALTQMVQNEAEPGSGSRDAALEMLAQMAPQSAEAREALLEQARRNTLLPYNWATLRPILSGSEVLLENAALESALGATPPADVNRTHIAPGNQNLYTLPARNLTPERLNQQAALINDLLAVTTDPTGIQVLQQSKDILSRRFTQPGGKPSAIP